MRWSVLSRFASCSVLLLMVALGSSVRAENWSRFRGPNGTGISEQQGIPVQWDEKDYAWNIELPGVGHASPIIWNDTLFVTTALDEGQVRSLICLDAKTGQQRWQEALGFNSSHKHVKNSYASSTPTTDGERVYVAFADKEEFALSAYDYAGKLVWRRLLGPFDSQHGLGVSPILYEDLLIIPNDQDGPSAVMAFNRRTGETVWSALRQFREASYATPIIIEPQGSEPQLICISGATGLSSLDPRTGSLNWTTGALPLRTVASPAYAGGLLFASCGQGGKGVQMIAVDPSGHGDVKDTHIKYLRKKDLPYVPTPVAYGDHLYLWMDNGVIACIDPKTDKTVWQERVGGSYSGSPICIDGKLYCVSEAGDVVVVDASPDFKLYGKTPLNDPSHSTPSVANGRLYLRTFHRLACLPARGEQ